MPFFDAHCDTIGPIVEDGADFEASGTAAGPQVTLPGLRAAGVQAQVFACWVWTEKHRGIEFDTAMAKVRAVRRLCADRPADLRLALSAADLQRAFAAPPSGAAAAAAEVDEGAAAAATPIAVLAALEGADSLAGEVDNLCPFYDAGVRLLTLAWGDNPFCGSTYGDGSGLTAQGVDLVAACEESGIVVDVSHLSDAGFADVFRVATRPFVASHSCCRALCPHPRNATDEMIRAIGERGGVMGVALACGFLSAAYYEKERGSSEEFFRAVASGEATVDEARAASYAAMAPVPRPPLSAVVEHVKHAMDVGGEDCVGLGGDLDGIDFLPEGMRGVGDYPRIEQLLRAAGLTSRQIEKVCYANQLRLFCEIIG